MSKPGPQEAPRKTTPWLRDTVGAWLHQVDQNRSSRTVCACQQSDHVLILTQYVSVHRCQCTVSVLSVYCWCTIIQSVWNKWKFRTLKCVCPLTLSWNWVLHGDQIHDGLTTQIWPQLKQIPRSKNNDRFLSPGICQRNSHWTIPPRNHKTLDS